MIAKHITKNDLENALKRVNLKYEENIKFKAVESTNRFETSFRFTLTVKDSNATGARRGTSGRKISAACWHVHGNFFDALIEISAQAVIVTDWLSRKPIIIDINGGNWQDQKVGGLINPFYISELCEC